MSILGGKLYLGTAAAVPVLGSVVVKVGLKLVIQLDLCFFALDDHIIDVVGLVGIGTRHFHVENHACGTIWHGVVALHLYPLTGSCLCSSHLIVVIRSVGIGIDHFDCHVLLAASFIHRAGRNLIALSGSHNASQRAPRCAPAGSTVIAIQ